MAITLFDPTFSTEVRFTIDSVGRTTATAQRGFNAFSNDSSDTEYTAEVYSETPRKFSLHPVYPQLFCSGLSIKKTTPVKFEIVADYISPPYREGGGGGDPNPLNQPTEVEYFAVSTEEEMDRDYDGVPIVTANQERMYGVKRTVTDIGIRLTKNFTYFDSATFYAYMDKVNSDTYLGFAPGTLKVMDIKSKRAWYQDSAYWPVTVDIHARYPYGTTSAKAWYARPLHQGYKKRIVWPFSGTQKIVWATDDNNERTPSPVQLNDNGFQVANDTFTAYFREFKRYGTAAFASMGF